MADAGLGLGEAAPFAGHMKLGEALMTPTRIYVAAVLALHKAGLLKGAAHITGGGLPGNLPRALPATMGAKLAAPWPMPDVFPWLAKTGNVATPEMLRVFNCGVGMALIVSDAEAAMAVLRDAGEAPFMLGAVTGTPGIDIENEGLIFA